MTRQLMCFLLYLGYLLVRPAYAEPTQRATMSAILAIFALPISRWSPWRSGCPTCAPSIPARCSKPARLTGVYRPPFLIGICRFCLLGSAMMLVRLHQESTRREIDSLRRELHAI